MTAAFGALLVGLVGAFYIVLEALFIYPKPDPKISARENFLFEIGSRWLRVIRIAVGLLILAAILLLAGASNPASL